eukprot:387905_1
MYVSFRKACDFCVSSKRSCTGEENGCAQCTKRGIKCHYSVRKKSGPKQYQHLPPKPRFRRCPIDTVEQDVKEDSIHGGSAVNGNPSNEVRRSARKVNRLTREELSGQDWCYRHEIEVEEQRQSDDNSQMSRSSLDSRSSNILSNEKESWAVQHRKPTPLLTDMGRIGGKLWQKCRDGKMKEDYDGLNYDLQVQVVIALALRFPGVDGTPKLKFIDDDVSYNIRKNNRSIEENDFQGSNQPWEAVCAHSL